MKYIQLSEKRTSLPVHVRTDSVVVIRPDGTGSSVLVAIGYQMLEIVVEENPTVIIHLLQNA